MSGLEGEGMGIVPSPNALVDLRCCTDLELVLDLIKAGASFDMVHMDAPWLYRGGKNNTQRGLAGLHYSGLPEHHIAMIVSLTALLAKPDSYLIFWCTFPKLFEWARMDAIVMASGWQYITGGVWGKLGGLGVGYHLRGDAELILVYKRGKPKVQENDQSDLWMIDVPPSLLWTAQRGVHSAKPPPILRDICDVFCPQGGAILNLYAGEQGTMERAARDTGHPITSCEADPARWQSSMEWLNKPELFLANQYDKYDIKGQLQQMIMELGDDEEGIEVQEPAGDAAGGGHRLAGNADAAPEGGHELRHGGAGEAVPGDRAPADHTPPQ